MKVVTLKALKNSSITVRCPGITNNGWPLIIGIDSSLGDSAVYYHSDRLNEVLEASSANVELRREADRKIKKLTEEIASLKDGQEG